MSRATGLRICALPRDPNPYQRLLYAELERLGARVRYVGELTGSRTLNLLLLPAELLARRLAGWRLLHVHWVYGFALPGAGRSAVLRRASQAWFRLVLGTARRGGMRVIWTAHNVLPHEPVFHDDRAARRTLVRAADLVLAHSGATLDELRALGAVPRAAAVVPHGPFGPAGPVAGRPRPAGARRLLFFGRVAEYKGVEDLLRAFAALPPGSADELTVAGSCADPALRERLTALAAQAGDRVRLRLEHIPDPELPALFEASDAVVLPFRAVTTSGTAVLALGHGKPLVLPDLPAFTELPDDAVVRYDGTVEGLTGALATVSSARPEVLEAMSAAAATHVAGLSWPDLAARTADAITRETGSAASNRRRGWLRRRLAALAPESLLRNSWFLAANLVVGALGGFVSLMLITRLYPTRDVGLGVTALSALALVTTMSQLGLNYSLLRFLPICRDRQAVANTALTLTGATAVLGAAVFLAIPAASGRLYVLGGVMFVAVFLLSNLLVALVTQVENVFVAYESARDVLRANLVTSGLKVALPVVLLPLAALGVFLTQSIAMAVGFVILAVVLGRRNMPIRPALKLRETRSMWRFSAGSYLAMMVGSLPLFILPLIILARFGAAQSAFWYAAIAIAGLLYQLPGCVSQVLLAQASARTTDRRALLVASARLIGLTMVPVLVLTYVLAPEVLEILGHAYAAASVTTLRWLVVAGVFTTVNFVTGTVLYLAKRTFLITWVELVDAVIVLGLSTLWAHDVTQVAIAWTVGEVSNLILFWLAAVVTVRQHGGRWERLGHSDDDPATGRPATAAPELGRPDPARREPAGPTGPDPAHRQPAGLHAARPLRPDTARPDPARPAALVGAGNER